LVDKLIPAQGVGRHLPEAEMHNDVIFPDFSAFHTTGAGGPTAAGAAGLGVADGAAHGQASHGTGRPGGAAGTGAGRLNTPPFSWLGGDAWPDFPR
jgi:hypothetical protein